VSGDEAAELMRLHREQVRMYDDIRTEPPEEGQKAVMRESRELTIEEFDEDIRGLVARYESSHPGVRITPLRYVAIGGREEATVVGVDELPDERLVTFVVTETILDGERAEVTSRMLVARANDAQPAS
jgi:hypothetical protein